MKTFSLAEFADHLLLTEIKTVIAMQLGLERVTSVIEADAKSRIGFYQGAVGPFQDWAPLAESTETEKARLGYPLDAPLLREGDLRDSIEHEVGALEAVVGSKSEIAAYQEFGTAAIPPRPFIGPAAYNNKDKILKIIGAATVAGLTGGDPIHASLGYDIKP